jgi:hypothetical protein
MEPYIPRSIFHFGVAFVCQAGNIWTLPLISIKEHLLQDGRNSCPEQVEDYAVYIKINLHILIGNCWFYFS